MAKLTTLVCDSAKSGSLPERLLGDGDGLFLRVHASGTKTWLVEYQHEGRRTKYTLGTYRKEGATGDSVDEWLRSGQLSLSQARAIASSWKSIRRAGRDPAAEWAALLQRERDKALAALTASQAELRQPTVKQAVELFMQKIMQGKKSAAAVQYRLNRLADKLGEVKLRDVTRKDVIAALDEIAKGQKKGQTAKQLAGEVLIQAKRLWRFAVERELIAESCIETLTRSAFDARPTKRDVTLRLDELAIVWRTISNPEICRADPVTVAALKILILTGQREAEVCNAEWAEVDLEAAIWRLPPGRTKSGRAHLVHLAPEAVNVLQALKAVTGNEKHIFASPLRPGQALYGRSVNNALGTLFKSGKLPHVTPCHVHDFRRTLISRLPDLGFEPFIGHKIANHVLSGVFAHYNHNAYEEQRKSALYAWAERVGALAAASNVAQFQRVA